MPQYCYILYYWCLSAPPAIGKLDDKFAGGITLHAGKSTIIEVPFTGAPQPKVTWQFNGQSQLPDRGRMKVETMHNTTALSLNRVLRSDAGTYSLVLENNNGKATAAVKVKVIGRFIVQTCLQSLSNFNNHTLVI